MGSGRDSTSSISDQDEKKPRDVLAEAYEESPPSSSPRASRHRGILTTVGGTTFAAFRAAFQLIDVDRRHRISPTSATRTSKSSESWARAQLAAEPTPGCSRNISPRCSGRKCTKISRPSSMSHGPRLLPGGRRTAVVGRQLPQQPDKVRLFGFDPETTERCIHAGRDRRHPGEMVERLGYARVRGRVDTDLLPVNRPPTWRCCSNTRTAGSWRPANMSTGLPGTSISPPW